MNTIYELAEKTRGLLGPFVAEVPGIGQSGKQGDRATDRGLSRHCYRASSEL